MTVGGEIEDLEALTLKGEHAPPPMLGTEAVQLGPLEAMRCKARMRIMMSDRRRADPKKFMHIRQELGLKE